jgi:hypothetical protein
MRRPQSFLRSRTRGLIRALSLEPLESRHLLAASPITPRVSEVLVFEGQPVAQFTVQLSEASTQTVTVDYTTGDGSAIGGLDYTRIDGLLTFAPGETSKTVSVPILDDEDLEPAEGFFLYLLDAEGATIDVPNRYGVATIGDNEAPNSNVTATRIVVDDVTVFEGDSGLTTVTLTARGFGPRPSAPVPFVLRDGTAKAGSDYVASSGTFDFSSSNVATTQIQIMGDTIYEDVEGFLVAIPHYDSRSGVVTIISEDTIPLNDPPPSVALFDAFGNEGSFTPILMPVRLSKPWHTPVIVSIQLTTGTATQGIDFVPFAGDLTFVPGQVEQYISVSIVHDLRYEPIEGIVAEIVNVIGATIADPQAVLAIVDDEPAAVAAPPPPTVSIGDVVVKEPNYQGAITATVPIRLSHASSASVVVFYRTISGTAIASADFEPISVTSGRIDFDVGEISRSISVTIFGDAAIEGIEGYFVELVTVSGAIMGDSQGIVTIVDTPGATPLPIVSLEGTTVTESTDLTGNGSTPAYVTIRLSHPVHHAVSVHLTTAGGTATFIDYSFSGMQVTFTPGQTERRVEIPIVADRFQEQTETIQLKLQSPTNASLGEASAVVTIVDNDSDPGNLPIASVEDFVIDESGGGMGIALVPVTLSHSVDQTTTVHYLLEPGTATPQQDYLGFQASVQFDAGTTTASVSIPLIDDATPELIEGLTITLISPSGVAIGSKTSAVVTIVDNDVAGPDPAYLFVTEVTAYESDDPTIPWFVDVPVTLSKAVLHTIEVTFSTSDGAAIAPQDYALAPGSLVFLPGETQKYVRVSIVGDLVYEGIEGLYVNLLSATGAVIAMRSAVVSIIDESDSRTLSFPDLFTLEPSTGLRQYSLILKLSHRATVPVSVDYQFLDGSATLADRDYYPSAGTLVIPAGDTQLNLRVIIAADGNQDEGPEAFLIRFKNPVGLTLTDDLAIIAIN